MRTKLPIVSGCRGDPLDIVAAEALVDLQAQKRRLDRDVRVDTRRFDGVEEANVLLDRSLRLGPFTDLLSQYIHGGNSTLGVQLAHLFQRFVQCFPCYVP